MAAMDTFQTSLGERVKTDARRRQPSKRFVDYMSRKPKVAKQKCKVLADVSTVESKKELMFEINVEMTANNSETIELEANKRQMSGRTDKRMDKQTQFPEIEETSTGCETTRKQLREIGSMLDQLRLIDADIAGREESLERRKQWCAHCREEANPSYYCCHFGDYCSHYCRDIDREFHEEICLNR